MKRDIVGDYCIHSLCSTFSPTHEISPYTVASVRSFARLLLTFTVWGRHCSAGMPLSLVYCFLETLIKRTRISRRTSFNHPFGCKVQIKGIATCATCYVLFVWSSGVVYAGVWGEDELWKDDLLNTEVLLESRILGIQCHTLQTVIEGHPHSTWSEEPQK